MRYLEQLRVEIGAWGWFLLLLWVAVTGAGLAQPVSATYLTLATDAGAAPVHTVVHLTATLQSTAQVSGAVTFLDNGQPLVSVALNSQGVAVLGIASLSQGAHTLAASYSGDASNAASVSAALAVSITSLPSALTLSASAATTYAGTPITLTAGGLPSAATGTVTFGDGAAILTSAAVPGVSTAFYQAMGDSITYGQSLAGPASRYADQFSANYGFKLADYGYSGSIACDVLPFQILANGFGPSQAAAPLSSLLIGTDDVDRHGTQAYQPVFQACHQAALGWLGIPREYKILAGDAGVTILSGTWTSNPGTFDLTSYGTLYNSSGSGTARFSVISAGGPVYVWYLMGDHLAGSFTIRGDGTPTGVSYSTQPPAAIGSVIAANPASIGYALLRLPVAAGAHVLDVAVQSGTVGILGVATAPSPGVASVHPTVLVGDVPNQLATNPQAPAGAIAQYTQSIQQDIALLKADGLDLRAVATQQSMLGSAAEMFDQVNPNALGNSHLAIAFENAFASSPTSPYSTFASGPVSTSITLTTPGTHTLSAGYSGDHVYGAAAAPPITVTVLAQADSATTLSTSATRYTTGTPVTFTAMVSPASATGTVSFYDGTSFLVQVPLASGSAAFTTSTLGLGLHSVTANYSGDSPDTPSGSPALTVEIGPYGTVVTLATIPGSMAYGTPVALSATTSPASATGAITFLDSFTAAGQSASQSLILGQSTLNNGSATFTATGLLPGTHTITGSYPGDTLDLAAVSAATTTRVVAVTSSTALTASPAALSYSSTETLTASVTPASAIGTVMFRDSVSGALATVALVNGSVAFGTTSLTPGPHAFTAVYSGDGLDGGSTSPSVSIQVNPRASTIVIAPVAASTNVGAALNLTSTITPASATGTVLYRDASTGTLGQATVNQGSATLTLNSLAAGAYSITAIYSGDSFDAPSTSAAVSTQVTPAATTTTLGALPASVLYGAALSLSATVSPATATGEITFTDNNSNPLGTAILINGMATLSVNNLGGGSHTIRAIYSGDSLNAASTSAAALTTIVLNSTTTTLSLAQVNVTIGNPIVFNVRVNSPLATTPSGTVAIRSGAVTLASGPLANAAAGVGYATLSANSATLGAGAYTATAFYSGDRADAASDSSGTSTLFSVVTIPTVTSLSLSATQLPLQGSTNLTATVSSSSQMPTGSVTFFSNGQLIATVRVTGSGTASTTLTATALGAYAISATFNPTGWFATSSSSAQALAVTLPITVALIPASINAKAGSTQSSIVEVTPLLGFTGSVEPQCQSSISYITCKVDTMAPITGPSPVSTSVHVTIAANTLAAGVPRNIGRTSTVVLALLLPLIGRYRSKRRHVASIVRLLILSTFSAMMMGCAEGGTFGDIPPEAETVQITVTVSGVAISSKLTVNIGP